MKQQNTLGIPKEEVEASRMPLYSYFLYEFWVKFLVCAMFGANIILASIDIVYVIDNIGNGVTSSIVFKALISLIAIAILAYIGAKFEDFTGFYTKIAYRLKIKSGKALTKEDFRKIKKENKSLYNIIFECMCQGYCYWTCFELLKALKQGRVFMVALKISDFERRAFYDGECATAHVLYEKDGWIFDTFSVRQWKKEEFEKYYSPMEFREFTYEDIKGMTYDEFKAKFSPIFTEYCRSINCYCSF